MGGDLGPLGLAHPQRPARRSRSRHSRSPHGARTRPTPSSTASGGDDDRHQLAGRGAARDEQQDADDGEDDAATQAEQAHPGRAAGRGEPAGPLGDVQLAQGDGRADQEHQQGYPDLGVDVDAAAREQSDGRADHEDQAEPRGPAAARG